MIAAPFVPERATEGSVALLGLPTDEASSFLRGAARGPTAVRDALHSPSSNLSTESGLDLGTEPRFVDVGDLQLPQQGTEGEIGDDSEGSSESVEPDREWREGGERGEITRARIEEATRRLLGQGARVLSVGGDHAVTYPLLRAYASHAAGPDRPDLAVPSNPSNPADSADSSDSSDPSDSRDPSEVSAPTAPWAEQGLTVVQVDAHPDLHHHFEGDRWSHACVFARVLETDLIKRLVQIGIRGMTPVQRRQAERFGVEVLDFPRMEQHQRRRPGWVPPIPGPIYLSVDLDGLDPSCAPGVSNPEPGGLSTREVIHLIQSLEGPLVGADVVELNPARDVYDLTARTAAKLVREIAARMLES